MNPPRSLITLPPEILLILIYHVGRRKDLINLALTSKSFYRIIVPSFLDYIHIRCDPRRFDLWQWISSKPHLAARVQTLELYNEECDRARPLIPTSFSPHPEFGDFQTQETFEESVLSLAAAVMLMTELRRFRWFFDLRPTQAFQDLFISLEQRNVMDEFCFGSNGISSLDDGIMDTQLFSPLANFHNVTTFCLEVRLNPKWHNGKIGNLIPHWIIELKQLNNLRLAFLGNDLLDLSIICDYANWPYLVELSLEGKLTFFPEFQDLLTDEEYDARTKIRFENFIRRHPRLQRLELRREDLEGDWSGLIQPQTVSQLRAFVWYMNDYTPEPLDDWFPQESFPRHKNRYTAHALDDQFPHDGPSDLLEEFDRFEHPISIDLKDSPQGSQNWERSIPVESQHWELPISVDLQDIPQESKESERSISLDHTLQGLQNWKPPISLDPKDIPQQLQYLECSISMGSIRALKTMTALCALYAVDIDLETFEHLVEAVPDIQKLRIPCRRWCNLYGGTTSQGRHIEDRVVSTLFKFKRLNQLEGLIGYTRITYIYEGIVKKLMDHGNLLYIDSFNREQLALIIKHLQAGKANIDGPLRELAATISIPNIQASAGFCTVSPATPLTV